MKCLHVLPMDKLSGAEKLVLLICRNMDKYKSVVVCGGENLSKIFEENGIKSYTINFNKNILKNSKSLRKIIQKENINIVHAHDNIASINSYITKIVFRMNFKLISHMHNCYPWLAKNGVQKKIDRFFRKNYNHNIACGNLVYDYYVRNTEYVNDKNTTILSNAIDVSEIEKFSMKNIDLYEKFNIPKDKIILGFIGRLSEQKGIIPFVKELSKYKDYFNDCRILIIGSGEEETELKKLIKEFNMDDLFILKGYQKNVYNFYPLIDIVFLPSLYEGLPMVILEAMSFRKSIISMRVGSIDELIKNEENGILIEKNNFKDFVEQLKLLKNDKIKRKKFEINSFKKVKKDYDIKVYIEKLNNLYDRIVSI